MFKQEHIVLLWLVFHDRPDEFRRLVAGLGPERMAKAVEEWLGQLRDRERLVVSRWCGLYRERYRAARIGRELGVGAGQVYQIRDRALRKLRHPKIASTLQKYMVREGTDAEH